MQNENKSIITELKFSLTINTIHMHGYQRQSGGRRYWSKEVKSTNKEVKSTNFYKYKRYNVEQDDYI